MASPQNSSPEHLVESLPHKEVAAFSKLSSEVSLRACCSRGSDCG